jgi:diguanylate cyclase (GGDEF)-like protein
MAIRSSSDFALRLEALIEKWASSLPPDVRQAFRGDFLPLGVEYDRSLALIERAWTHRERAYAFDETGLARRRPFHDHLVALLSVGGSGSVGVLFADVDRLKTINDTFGHAAGDQAVQAVGALLRESLRFDRDAADVLTRTADEQDDYSVSHFGGDEFVAALELRSAADMNTVAQRVSQRINDPEAQRAHGFVSPAVLTVSVGGVVCHRSERTMRESEALARSLVVAADQQMYVSKRDGQVHVALVSDSPDRPE